MRPAPCQASDTLFLPVQLTLRKGDWAVVARKGHPAGQPRARGAGRAVQAKASVRAGVRSWASRRTIRFRSSTKTTFGVRPAASTSVIQP